MHQPTPPLAQNPDILETLLAHSAQLSTDCRRLHETARSIAASRHKVEPVSARFFKVTDSRTGKVRGWRQTHLDACALARQLDAETA